MPSFTTQQNLSEANAFAFQSVTARAIFSVLVTITPIHAQVINPSLSLLHRDKRGADNIQLPSPSSQAATVIIMAMCRTTPLLLLVLVVVSIGLVHSYEARDGSIIRAAESSEQDKHNPMFKVSMETRRSFRPGE